MSEKVRIEGNTSDLPTKRFKKDSLQEDRISKDYLIPEIVDIDLNVLDHTITCSCTRDDDNPW